MCNLTRIKNLSRFVVIVVGIVVWHEKWPSFSKLRIRNVCVCVFVYVRALCISARLVSPVITVWLDLATPSPNHSIPNRCAPLQRTLHAFSYPVLSENCFTHRLSHCSQGFFVSSKSLPSSLVVVVVVVVVAVVVVVLTNSASYCKRCYCQCHYYLLLSLLFFMLFLLLLIFVVIFHLMFSEYVCEVFFPLFCSISVWCL